MHNYSLQLRDQRFITSVTSNFKRGVAWVVPLIECLPSAQVAIPESWDGLACGSLLRGQSVPLPSSCAHMLSFSLAKIKIKP